MVRLKELQISWTPKINFSDDERKRLAARGVYVGVGCESAIINNQSVIGMFIAYDRAHNSPAPIDVVEEYLRSALVNTPRPQISERRVDELDGTDLEF